MLRNNVFLRFLMAAFLNVPGAALFGLLAAGIAASGFRVTEEIAATVGACAFAVLQALLLWKFRLEIAGEPKLAGLSVERPDAAPARKPVLWYIAQAYLPAMGGMFFALLIWAFFPENILSAGQTFAFIAIPAWILYMAVFFLACEIPQSGLPRFRPRTE